MKTKILKRIEITPEQTAAITAAVAALSEICAAYEVANGERPGFEIILKVERRTDMSGEYPFPRRAFPWWTAGDILTNNGHGRVLEEALAMHFAATDATKKREAAQRCLAAARNYEREADELEKIQAGESVEA